MEIRLDQLAELVNGSLIGDGNLVCRGANPPGQCGDDEVTMLVDGTGFCEQTPFRAIAVLTPVRIESCQLAQIIVADPHAAFAKVVSQFRPPWTTTLPGVGVSSSARIASSAKVHPTATIGEGVVIGERTLVMPGCVIMPNCKLGNDCVIYPNVTLYEHTHVGDRVNIHAGCVIGAHGFGYRQQNGRHVSTSQLGYVKIGNDVDLGACVTIDRGTYGATRIGEGTKIDNQVMIAHNCQIGRHNLICSQVGVAGSCTTGDYVVLAGQVGLKDHVSLGDRAVVGAKAGVMDDCQSDQVYLGAPAMPQREQMQIFALQRKLPDMRRELKQLRKQMDAMSQHLESSTSDAGGSDQARHTDHASQTDRAA